PRLLLCCSLTLPVHARPPLFPYTTLFRSLDQLALSLRDAPMLGDAALGWQSLKVEGVDTAPLARQVALGKGGVDGLTWRSQLGVAAPASAKASNAKAEPQAASSASAVTAESKKTPDAWAWRVGEIDLRTGRIDVQPVMPAPQTPAGRRGAGEAKAPLWPALDSVHVSVKSLD